MLKKTLDALSQTLHDYSPEGRAGFHRLLERASKEEVVTPQELLAYHELLLFTVTYPADLKTLRLAEKELTRLEAISRKRCQVRRKWDDCLEDSGITGSKVRRAFTLDALRWLAKRAGTLAEIDWECLDDNEGKLDDFIRTSIPGLADAVLNTSLTTRELLEKLAAPRQSQLAFLCRNLYPEGELATADMDKAFDALEIQVTWRVGEHSRTTLRGPQRRVYFHNNGLSTSPSVERVLNTALPKSRALSAAQRQSLVDLAMSALLARGRETDPVTYANLAEVTHFQLDFGIDVILFGLVPSRRLPLESYIGFLALKNRVPVAYGGAWILGQRAEIGVNVFETFRGADSYRLFAEVMRVYRQYYNIETFLVQSYQFGDENDEGIQSGAFWFYYKLGFRPLDPTLRLIAEKEVARRKADPLYRTGPKTLKRLAKENLSLKLSKAEEAYDVSKIGLAVALRVSRQSGGDMIQAQAAAIQTARKLFDPPAQTLQAIASDAVARKFLLLTHCITRIGAWTRRDKAAFLDLALQKAGPHEREFILGVQKHDKLRAMLRSLELSSS